VKVGPNAWIAPGLTVYGDVPGDVLLISRQEHEERPK
jgi:bifunctional N-acetylglucosamine-1-phosphate-uridyltransferase/glucosamine-1-phosphate-acetyltransferase GlmU-like protein